MSFYQTSISSYYSAAAQSTKSSTSGTSNDKPKEKEQFAVKYVCLSNIFTASFKKFFNNYLILATKRKAQGKEDQSGKQEAGRCWSEVEFSKIRGFL